MCTKYKGIPYGHAIIQYTITFQIHSRLFGNSLFIGSDGPNNLPYLDTPVVLVLSCWSMDLLKQLSLGVF